MSWKFLINNIIYRNKSVMGGGAYKGTAMPSAITMQCNIKLHNDKWFTIKPVVHFLRSTEKSLSQSVLCKLRLSKFEIISPSIARRQEKWLRRQGYIDSTHIKCTYICMIWLCSFFNLSSENLILIKSTCTVCACLYTLINENLA